MFIVGELGGLALIKNAINQGRDCVDIIERRLSLNKTHASVLDLCDLLIIGAGPAGISASLRAAEKKLDYLTLEQSEIGGTVAKYPRQKLVLTSPVEFPMHGKFKKTELSKRICWNSGARFLKRADFKCRTGEKVETLSRGRTATFASRRPMESFGRATSYWLSARPETRASLVCKAKSFQRLCTA